MLEGGESDDEIASPGIERYNDDEEEDYDGLDEDDPYQIKLLNEIPHEELKDLYT